METMETEVPEDNFEKKPMMTDKFRENPWILSTLVLGIVSLILIVGNFSGVFGGMTGNVISSNDAGQKLLSFYEATGAEGLTLNSVEEVSGVYQVNFEYQGAVVPIFVTKDGQLAGSLSQIKTDVNSSSTSQEEVSKSDKPKVELYVFTYCPYGLQMEKAMIPVAKLFGNKIDFKIRQIGAMHGEFEAVEAKRQLCIEKEYPSKYLDYVDVFAKDTSIGSCNGDATCLAPKLNSLYSKLDITGNKIDSCMKTSGDSLYTAEQDNSQANGVSGSPTLIINGVVAQVSRNPDAIKEAVCSAFNAAPSECSQTLSTESASAGFGISASTNVANSHPNEQC